MPRRRITIVVQDQRTKCRREVNIQLWWFLLAAALLCGLLALIAYDLFVIHFAPATIYWPM